MNRIPLRYHADSLSLFERLRALPQPVLLHSSDRTSAAGRYDVMSADPTHPVVYHDGVLRVGTTSIATKRPLDSLRTHFKPSGTSAPAHFRTGFIGYFGYGLQHSLQRLPPGPPDVTGLPQMCGGNYAWSVVTNHAARTTDLWYDSATAAPRTRVASPEDSRETFQTRARAFRSDRASRRR